ncbi:hypothetical protein [Actinomadura litoris]|uniref:hypothetical protein n=1 Tax=Actinomadura litoris TaxID=2678616 RepID=UPI001FA71B3A|nr:hypothetical protein [Actinomadura litoris]
MGRRLLAVLGGLMMTTDALVVVAPASLGVASAPTTLRIREAARASRVRPVPIRSLTAAPAAAHTALIV